jgi:hypothetical protein
MTEMIMDSNELKIPEFQNFLKNSPYVSYNLVPSETGEIKLSANLAAYT